MQFGIYLVDRGVLSPEDFVEAAKLQLNSRPQIGALAVQLRKLTCRQVFSILRAQCDGKEEMFGATAASLGYLSKEDVERLVAEQSRRAKPMREILVEQQFVPADVVEKYYREYRHCVTDSGQPVGTGASA